MHFAENASKWCAQSENDKTCWSRAENAVCTNSCTFMKIANKWWAECQNDKTFWSRPNNAVLLFKNLVHFAKRVKKWCTQCKNESTCWSKAENAVLDKLVHFAENRLKVVQSAKMLKPPDIRLEILFCRNSCSLLKMAKTEGATGENDKTFWSRKKAWSSPAENAFLYKLMHFAGNAKKWCVQSENDKTCWSRAENAIVYKLVHFHENR